MMKRTCYLALTFTCVALLGAADKGTVVDFDGLKSTAPADWKEEGVTSQLRHMQFKIPKAKDDKDDGELVIFKGITGSAKQNIDRWKGMFVPPEGKKIDDVAKVTEIKIGGQMATRLDITGTYKFKARPFDPNAKEELKAGYSMTAIQLDGDKNIYHIRLVGPAKTIGAQQKAFDEWVKNFK